MSDNWLSRITGKSRSSAPGNDPLGIWVDPSNGPWVGVGDEAIGIGKNFLPNPVLISGVERVSQNLSEASVESWGDWKESLPVDVQLAEPPKLRKEEKITMNAIQHFEEISRLPRAHLKVEELRIPVGQARRFPPRALNILASHSEDWHSRSFNSVRPNRVLSEVRDDDYAIYENRALKTLQQRLLSALIPRLAILRSLRDALDASNLDSSGGRRFSLDRLCELLYELFTEDPNRPALDSLIQNLESLSIRLLSLEGMFLFKEIKFATRVLSPLQSTNILRDDSHYRHIFRVWMAWETRSKKKITRKEKLIKQTQAFDQFTGLLCVRAINLLHMSNDRCDHDPFLPGASPVSLKHHWSLKFNQNGTLTFNHQDNRSQLLIIGVPTQLSRLPVNTIQQMVSQIEAQVATGISVLLVTLEAKGYFPDSWSENLKNKLNTWSTKTKTVPACFLAEVSAMKLNSTELIARVFRRIIAEHDWPILPIKISLEEKFQTSFPQFTKDVSNQWSKPPSENLQSRLKKTEQSSKKELNDLKRRLDQAQQDERDARSQKHRAQNNVNFNKLKHELREKISNQKEKNEVLAKVLSALQGVELSFQSVLNCPCCGNVTTAAPIGSAFTCSSDSCKTQWGRQHDRSVFLWPDGDDPSTTKENPLQMFGADYI